MEKKLTIIKSLRYSLVFIIVIALIYFLKFLENNGIFNIGRIDLFKSGNSPIWGLPSSFNLPVIISRMWDLPIIFLIIFFIIKTFYYIRDLQHRNNYLICGLVLSLLVGFAVGALASFVISGSAGIMAGVIVVLILSLIFGLFLGLAYDPVLNFLFGLESGVTAGLTSMLVCVFAFGSVAGIIFGIILGLAMFMGVSLGAIIRYPFSRLV